MRILKNLALAASAAFVLTAYGNGGGGAGAVGSSVPGLATPVNLQVITAVE